MEPFTQELRRAARSLVRSPGFALAAVLTLALGIGANTAIFSVVDGVLLRPAPFADMSRLVMVWESDRKSGTTREPASVADYLDFRRQSTRVAQFAAFSAGEVSLTPPGVDPFRAPALAVSAEFLPVLGVQPLVGRHFSAAEDLPGAPTVALISETLWQQLYARDRDVVGRTMSINDQAVAIIGVLPASADFGTLQILGAAAYGRGFADRGGPTRVDIWVPLRADPDRLPRETHPIFVMGRLAAGATAAHAQDELSRIAADLEAAYPENDGRGVTIEPLGSVVFGPVRPALLVLLGAVALVLLVACGNVANLMLARGAGRRREVTVRLALGATPGRLARQFFAESVVLTAAGAAAGLALAFAGLRLLIALAPTSIPRVGEIGLDARVLAVTLAVSVAVGVAFGAVPLLQAWTRDIQGALRSETGRGATAGREQRRLRAGLVVAELTLAVMLMIGAGLLIQSLWRLQRVDPGFAAGGVLKAEFQLPGTRYPASFDSFPRWPVVRRFVDEARRRAAALPGVAAVAIASNHPLDAGYTSSISVVGREAEADAWPEPAIRRVDHGYFAALRVPLLAGRTFQATDETDAAPVMLINEAARRRFFATQDPLGQLVVLWGRQRAVIGVVGDERIYGLAQNTPPSVYLPLTQAPATGGTILIRARGDAAALIPDVRAVVRALDPALPLFGVEPLIQTISNSLGQRRFTMVVLGVFALLALTLAAIGVHGVLSYNVVQRTHEIGVRLALGADSRSVRGLIMSQAARLAAAGVALGMLGGLATTQLLTALLYGVRPVDLLTFAGVALVLAAVALLASWLPARRATGVDPMVALRSE
jgi:predicted permease